MFEFDAGKLIIIGIVALIVIGPKELPRVLRQVGQAAAKLRRLGAEFRAQFMEAVREADSEELKTHMRELTESTKVDLGADPLTTTEVTATLEQPVGQLPAASVTTNSDKPGQPKLPAPSAAPQA